MRGYTLIIGCRRIDTGRASSAPIRPSGWRATLLPYSRRAEFFFLLPILLTAVIFVVAPPLIRDVPRTGTLSSELLHTVGPFLPVFVIPCLAVLGSRVARKRGQLGLGLASDGVYTWTWFGCCFFAWDWISDISATHHREHLVELQVREPLDRPKHPEETWVGNMHFFRGRKRKIQVGYLAVNAAAAHYALCFYHRHPELRAELGRAESIDRIRRLDLPGVYDEVRRFGDVRAAPRPG
jgi:hypothetical protein